MTTQDAVSGPQREPDERVREALAVAAVQGRATAPHGTYQWCMFILAAALRRLQAAQRERAAAPRGYLFRHHPGTGWSFSETKPNLDGHTLAEIVPLYTQVQRDDHPPAATLDCICGKQANVRCLVHGPDSLDAQFFMHARQTWGDKADENELQEARFNFAAGYNAGLKALGLVRQHPTEGLLREARDVTQIVKDWFAARNLGPSADAIQYTLQEMLAKLDAALAASKGTPDLEHPRPRETAAESLSVDTAVAERPRWPDRWVNNLMDGTRSYGEVKKILAALHDVGALASDDQDQVKPGFVLVPVEPTLAMAQEWEANGASKFSANCYRAMLAARPEPTR